MIEVVKIESDLLNKVDQVLTEFHKTYLTKDQAVIKILRIIEDEKRNIKSGNNTKTD